MNRPEPFDATPIIAHRGASSLAPENTLMAAEAAYLAGADMWELDVRSTADGQLVLAHDSKLTLKTDIRQKLPTKAKSRIRELQFAELQLLDVGSWYVDDQAWVCESPFPDLPVIGSLNNIHLQMSACRAGMGLSTLPCFIADPHLERLTAPKPSTDIWVLVHPDLRRNPHLRLFRDEMVTSLKKLRPLLEGTSASSSPS